MEWEVDSTPCETQGESRKGWFPEGRWEFNHQEKPERVLGSKARSLPHQQRETCISEEDLMGPHHFNSFISLNVSSSISLTSRPTLEWSKETTHFPSAQARANYKQLFRSRVAGTSDLEIGRLVQGGISRWKWSLNTPEKIKLRMSGTYTWLLRVPALWLLFRYTDCKSGISNRPWDRQGKQTRAVGCFTEFKTRAPLKQLSPTITISPSSSVQFSHSVVPDSLQPHGLQHARLPSPSPTPGAYSNSCPLSWWCHPTISSSVVPFTFCLQSFPAPGSFPMSQFFPPGGQSIGASATASVLPMNIQDWFPLGIKDN